MRLLLVDDSDQLRRVVKRRFEREGVVVAGEARDGVDALAFLDSCDDVDAVVLDAQMPRMDGIAAVRHITDRHPEVLVVGFSSDPSAEEPMLAGGAVAFVLKGADDEVSLLLDAMRRQRRERVVIGLERAGSHH